MAEFDPIVNVAIVLAAALVGGMVAHRLRQPVILGYLLVGVAVGPYGFGLVGDAALGYGIADLDYFQSGLALSCLGDLLVAIIDGEGQPAINMVSFAQVDIGDAVPRNHLNHKAVRLQGSHFRFRLGLQKLQLFIQLLVKVVIVLNIFGEFFVLLGDLVHFLGDLINFVLFLFNDITVSLLKIAD